MQPIEGKLNAPFQRKICQPVMHNGESGNKTVWESNNATVYKIRCSDGSPVKTFKELVNEVALVTLNNKNYEMYYRGQTIDYKDSTAIRYRKNTPKTIIYPSICRPEKKEDGSYKTSIKGTQIRKRYEELYNLIDMANDREWKSNEYHFSLFQHYDILQTPLIDITQSLRVAASFSLRNSDSGYLYVFGLPYPYQSISYFNDLGIVLVKLQNVCPVEALRPRYQEGYLVGKFPIRPSKEASDNLAQRLVAKFYIDNKDGKFWDRDFQPMPKEVLYPENDECEIELKELKNRFIKKVISLPQIG
jgi:hypothetical protein